MIPLINFNELAGNMSDPDMNLNTSSSLDLVTTPSPPVYLFTMMGIWASLTGLLGIVANILAIGVFIRVKRVITFFSQLQLHKNLSSEGHLLGCLDSCVRKKQI